MTLWAHNEHTALNFIHKQKRLEYNTQDLQDENKLDSPSVFNQRTASSSKNKRK